MVRYPVLIASYIVDIVGEKRDAWSKLIVPTMLGASTTELMESLISGGASIVYKLLSYLVPFIISFLLKSI